MVFCPITFHNWKKICGEAFHNWCRESCTPPASQYFWFTPNKQTIRWNLGLTHPPHFLEGEFNLKEQDLIKLFGFKATTYLKEKCRVDLRTGKNGKNKGFDFAVMYEHVQKELHGIEFRGNNNHYWRSIICKNKTTRWAEDRTITK